jgi:predicted nucleic acid-binding protein
MNRRKGVVLDANILLRPVFGTRVRHLLESYEDSIAFYRPDVCFLDAQEYIPRISARKSLDASAALTVLAQIGRIVQFVDVSLYEDFERVSRERVGLRDPEDWPVVAVSLLLQVPVWTEDQDFFGSGVAVWTTDRVEQYLKS